MVRKLGRCLREGVKHREELAATYSGLGRGPAAVGQPRGPSGAFIWYARYLADLQAMPQGGSAA